LTVAGTRPPIIHSNYAEFYGDEGVHPRWSPDYAPLLAAMTILPANTVQGRHICQAIKSNQNVQYFMCIGLFGDPAHPTSARIDVVHRLTFLSAPFLGGGDAAIHDKLYGIVGDIMTGNQFFRVVVPADALDVITSTRIASDQVFDAAIANDTLAETYGPYTAAGVDNQVAATRGLCFVTPQVASLIIKATDRTPRGIILLLLQELTAPLVASLAPLFQWLRVAQTDGADLARHPLVSAPPREEVNKMMMRCVSLDLPLLGQQPIYQVGQQISNAMGTLTATVVAESAAARLSRSASSQSQKMTIQKKFSFQEEPLRRLLQIRDLKDAPPVWHVLSSHNVKQVRQVLQTALGETCYQEHVTPPILHQALTRIIVDPSSWRCSDGPSNVLQGFSLFHVLLRPPADELERMKAAASYDLAMSTDSSLSSADTYLFNNPGHVATTWVEPLVAKMTLKHMWALCVTLFGRRHTVTEGLRLALQRWDQFEMTLHAQHSCSPDTWTMQVLYWFHRQLSHWIEVQYHSDAIESFLVEPLFLAMKIGDPWSRGLPLEYVPARLLPGPPAGPAPTVISALTPDAPQAPPAAPSPAPAAAPPPDTGVAVHLPTAQQVPRLTAYDARRAGRRLYAIIGSATSAGHALPNDRHQQPFCLSYHITCQCNSQCNRRRNHRQLSEDEITRLAVWCELAF
jgi:hypothetical protein